MSSRYATYTLIFILGCLTSVASGQTSFDRTRMLLPLPAIGQPSQGSYPQTNSQGRWHAGSPTGISALPPSYALPPALPIALPSFAFMAFRPTLPEHRSADGRRLTGWRR